MRTIKFISLLTSLFWIFPLSAAAYPGGISDLTPLTLEEMPNNPMNAFEEWFQSASTAEGKFHASTMTLSTATPSGRPSSRTMMLKEMDDQGLIFYGDLRSEKFKQLRINPYASIVFYWPAMKRQVIFSGKAIPLPSEVAGEYFATRKKERQAASHASNQGYPLKSREELITAHKNVLEKYGSQDIPPPNHWGGYQLIPDRVEFWQAGLDNLHYIVEYTKSNGHWSKQLLHP